MVSPARKKRRRNLCRGLARRAFGAGPAAPAGDALCNNLAARFRSGMRRLRCLEANCRFDLKRAGPSDLTSDASSSTVIPPVNLESLRERADVTEIVVTDHGLVFALTRLGACSVFDRARGFARVCYLNVTPDDTVRSLFYNRVRNAIISVSVCKKDDYRQLRCRSTRLEDVRAARSERGISCFVSEELKYPGFIEFDAVNERVLTYAAKKREYKIWDLATYACLFAMTDRAISEVKISPGALLVMYKTITVSKCNDSPGIMSSYALPVKVLSLDGDSGGDVLHERELALEPASSTETAASHAHVEFVEHSDGRILSKQTGYPLKIFDLRNREEIVVNQFVAPNSFIFLNKIRRFLVFRGHTATLFNFRGECVSTFEDHMLWFPDANMNNVFISSAQDVMISFCRNTDAESMPGSVNVSHIRTGRLLAKISAARTGASPRVGGLDSWEEEDSREEPREEVSRDAGEEGEDEFEETLDLGGGAAIQRSVLVSDLAAVAAQIMSRAQASRVGHVGVDGASAGREVGGVDSGDVVADVEARVPVAFNAAQEVVQRRRAAEEVQQESNRQAGLRRVTCIAYDEVNCEILTGNALGQISVWGH